MLNGTPIGLPAMLTAREQRAARQLALRQKYHRPQLSFGLNIPGPVKTTPALRQLFDQTCLCIRDRLRELNVDILDSQTLYAPTGNEYLLAFDGDETADIFVEVDQIALDRVGHGHDRRRRGSGRRLLALTATEEGERQRQGGERRRDRALHGLFFRR